ncbi:MULTISPECIES: TraR/DksA C4-type zinc finger protein [Halomonadaceae]|uniref:TraR/DksA C4-type zinc finger protein n=2 Tax=Vreelandella TaxID=3137766 RepID=A0A7Z0S0A0_9GAMM|nr:MULTISPECIES: TraR/DksA C4-type zinc finger protein [Halomonas]NYS80177.1 TraR/DksA C4-type zinc finger protein [Halomonas glaciei]|tara:strand:- start:708 stop:1034 length:327 start_codon:yes stop_codon:yes gene_type:complete
MSTQDRKALLDSLRLELKSRIHHYEDHQHRSSGALNKDLDDQALEVQNDEVVARLEEEARVELVQTERALERIAAQVGDRCEECGNPIEPERLEALPYTTRCKSCADL